MTPSGPTTCPFSTLAHFAGYQSIVRIHRNFASFDSFLVFANLACFGSFLIFASFGSIYIVSTANLTFLSFMTSLGFLSTVFARGSVRPISAQKILLLSISQVLLSTYLQDLIPLPLSQLASVLLRVTVSPAQSLSTCTSKCALLGSCAVYCSAFLGTHFKYLASRFNCVI